MADFTPTMGDYTELKPFRYWCQKVLPLVYDDTLSYYELLCKVVDYLNKTMEDVDTLHDDVEALHDAYVELQTYVNTYFDSLDVQQEINNKLDEMATDGTLVAILQPTVAAEVAAWLSEHLTPTTPAVDDTLTVSEAAADAKTVGDDLSLQYAQRAYKINEMVMNAGGIYRNATPISSGETWTADKWNKTTLTDILNILMLTQNHTQNLVGDLVPNTFINYSNGAASSYVDENFFTTDFIRIAPGSRITVSDYRAAHYNADAAGLAFYNKNKTFISGSGVRYTKPNKTLVLTAPDNACYIRATAFADAGSNIKIFSSTLSEPFWALKGLQQTFNSAQSAPYDNANTIPQGTICTYVGTSAYPSNLPTELASGALNVAVITIITLNYTNITLGGSVQILYGDKALYVRYAATESTYTAWRRLEYETGFAIANSASFVAPWNDADTIPRGTIVTYIGSSYIPAHAPVGTRDIATVITFNYKQNTLGGSVQAWFDSENVWIRQARTETTYSPWVSMYSEKNAIHAESVFSLFPKVGVIGDSYASGALTLTSYTGNDHYAISWPQILARKCGIDVVNFSKGGLTTKSWLTDAKGLTLLNSEDAKDLYVLTLGINDNATLGSSYLGTAADIGTGADTFYGNYSTIIEAIIEKAPNAKIVMSTMAPSAPGSYVSEYNTAILAIAAAYSIPCMVQGDDPFFTSTLYTNNISYNHPTANGYVHMANAFDRMLCKVMDNNVNYFKDYGLYMS